jgi:hypothetical protein
LGNTPLLKSWAFYRWRRALERRCARKGWRGRKTGVVDDNDDDKRSKVEKKRMEK